MSEPVVQTDDLAASTPRYRLVDRRDARAFLILVGAGLALGALGGLLWGTKAPRPKGVTAADGVYPDSATVYVAMDGWFFAITAIAGIVLGLAAVLAFRRSGVGVTLGVAVGGLLGGLGCWWLGTRIGYVDVDALAATLPVGSTVEGSVRLRIPGLLLVMPGFSLLVVLIGVSFGVFPRDED